MSAPETTADFVAAYEECGSVKAVARRRGITYHRARKLYRQAVDDGTMKPLRVGRKGREEQKAPAPEGRIDPVRPREFWAPGDGVRTFLFTGAQNDTLLHVPLWENLMALADHYDAQVHVSRFTYVKAGLGAKGDKAQVLRRETLYGGHDMAWDARLVPHFSDERAVAAPGLTWCGEMNIIPTAVRPLSGLEVYAQRDSGIFPHVKIAMDSVPRMPGDPPRFNYTTGTVTQQNYIQRKAGLKAAFHHCYGALLVEVDADGTWFARQLNAEADGTVQDLDVVAEGGRVRCGERVEAVTWGDVHVADLVPQVGDLAWGAPDSMIATLRPRYQFMHDVLDFRSRSHHEIADPHRMFAKRQDEVDDVAVEISDVRTFLEDTARPGVQTVVVPSNHHDHLGRWLRDKNGLHDPVNALTWARLNAEMLRFVRETGWAPSYLELALTADGDLPENVCFLDADASFVICEDDGGGIECAMHGHAGPNGSRGSAKGFARMGRRANVGHTHQAGIVDGVYVAGTCGSLSPAWASGPTSWSWSHVATYPNAKRAIVTMRDGRWRVSR